MQATDLSHQAAAMRKIADIPDQANRLAEITVDCYGQDEELSAFEVYFSDALQPPFSTRWRDPDEPGHEELITVLGGIVNDQRRGILLTARRRGGKERRILAERFWAAEDPDSSAIGSHTCQCSPWRRQTHPGALTSGSGRPPASTPRLAPPVDALLQSGVGSISWTVERW